MKRVLVISIVMLMILIASMAWSAIIHVPGDQPTIQAGIDTASDGDAVLVADGTYTGDGNRDIDFNGKAITVTSEGGAENCILDCQGLGRGFYFHSGETEASVVSGFTIKKGIGSNGGGISCVRASPTIKNNIIAGNFAGLSGGGIYCLKSSPTIMNNTISRNFAVGPTLTFGGGICCDDSSSPIIKNNNINENIAASGGGGIHCVFASPIIINNLISGNSANAGGGINCAKSFLTIINNTISGNLAENTGGGIDADESSVTVVNNILWKDSPNEIYVGYLAEIIITYSDIQGGWPGEGNIDAAPLFVDPDNGDYHLQAGSPCIDAGTPIGAPPNDIEGNPRDEFPDMGAYEYQGVSTGSIYGTVTDITGKPIHRAIVIAINLDTNEKSGDITAAVAQGLEPQQFEPGGWDLTDVNGYYEITNIIPGTYLMLCLKTGYKPGIRKIEVLAGEVTECSFVLQPKLE